MALTKHGFKDQNWSHFLEGEQTVEGEKRREEEEEEEEEKEEEEGGAKKGMELTLGMNSCMNFHTIAWLLVVP